MYRWPLQDAKNRFSSLVEACLKKGPQIVTKRGKETAVLISMQEYKRLTRPQGDLVDFFRCSPLKEVELDLERNKELPREIDL
ncbi:MAG: type II toxin-antitoxin system Phd/YefM family antitoxin [Desulfohalobiaceae bacterium]